MSWNKSQKQRRKRSRSSSSPVDHSRSNPTFPLPDSWTLPTSNEGPKFFVEAHEADIVTSHNDEHLTLECPDSENPRSREKGSALLRWSHNEENERNVWVDRYDARLLLSVLPRPEAKKSNSVDPGSVSTPPSPTGWSDLPSDSEDTFFFTASETSDFRRNKRRRLLDAAQNARLQSLRERDGEDVVDSEDVGKEVWGDDDEEPDEAQAELMRRTARHVASSPDPVVLEMRILANHGDDGRLAFLRGRWKLCWQRAKALAKAEVAREKAAAGKPSVGMNLADYGESDEEQDGDESGREEPQATTQDQVVSSPTADPEDAIKAARRLRAKEWSARRRKERTELDKGESCNEED